MKKGVRAHDFGKMGISELAVMLKNNGVDYVQLAIPRAVEGMESFDDITEEVLRKIRVIYEEQEIKIAVFSCYQDLSDPDPQIRKLAVDTFIRCLKWNKILGADVVGTETSYSHLSQEGIKERFPYMMESLVRIKEAAESLDADFAIEPVAWHPLCNPEVTRLVCETLNSSHVKVIFDPANVYTDPSNTEQRAYWKKCFALLGERIAAIHIKDFYFDEQGQYIAKLLGEGCMDYSVLAGYLKEHPEVPVIREEADPRTIAQDFSYMDLMM